jgi:peptidyl-prolyl cis-trans isomerase SurA
MHHRKIAAAVCAICAASIAALTPPARAFPQSAGADTARADTMRVDMMRGVTPPVDTTRAAAPAGAGAAGSGGVLVDGIVATVEDRAIFRSEVDNEIRNFMLQTQRTSLTADEEKMLRQEALNSLVATALLSAQAERENLKVEDKEVEDALDRWIEQKKTEIGGDDAFDRQLAAEGLTMEALRDRYRENIRTLLIIEKIKYQKIMPEIQVSEAEVRAYYQAHLSEIPQKEPSVSIAQILVVPKPSEAVLAKALEKITMIEGKLAAGEDFAATAKAYSDCPSAKFGGNLGTLNLDELGNPPFAEAARKVPVGQVSEPVLTEFGYHLIKIEKVDGDQVTLRHILVRAEPVPEDVETASKLAERLRTELAAGGDFAKAAAEHSRDYATKDKGGVFGAVEIKNLPDNFREAIKGVPAGGIAPVLKEERGFRIVKVLSWNAAGTYSYDEVKNQVRRLVMEKKIMERMNEYVEELKKEYAVAIKGA